MQKKSMMPQLVGTIAAVVLFALLVPMVTDAYSMTVLNTALIYFIAVLGISIMLGMGGQISFATSAFLGFGAFATANFSTILGLPPVWSILLSIVVTGLFSWIMGLALFRLKGSYFTFASIALVQIMQNVYTNLYSLTGGPDGISRIPHLSLFGWEPRNETDYFYIILVLCVAAGVIVERIRSSTLGRSLAAVRDNEIAAMSLGVNVYRTKVISFVIAGCFAGFAGALISHHNTYVSATQFTFDQSSSFVVMAMIGGVASTFGAFIGTLLITMLPEWFRPLQEYLRFSYGIAVMILMVFMPMGLAGIVKTLCKRIRKKSRNTANTLKGGQRNGADA